ncbi:hypothetical protein JZU56_05890, partial [bacterium]|nr:hypothetical protein [bacterium]
MRAASKTLDLRGNKTTGWALAHRMNSRARLGEGDNAYEVYQYFIRERTLPNLWSVHPPFMIDASLGTMAGVAEMLLQSHEEYIKILPALPKAWNTGSFSGLVARGNFVISAEWKDGKATAVAILARSGGECRVDRPAIGAATVRDSRGNTMDVSRGDVHRQTNLINRRMSMNNRLITGMILSLSVVSGFAAGRVEPAGNLVKGRVPETQSQQVDLYVSPDGSDAFAGTTKEKPFASLAKARDAVRAVAGKNAVTVHVADGVYYLPETLTFSSEDSGSAACPVVYRAEHEGGAVLSGGSKLALDWKTYRDGIFQTKTSKGLEIDQLFINGKAQRMARYPNFDASKK